jgi:DNA-directed RNA polymerase subunit RPC12/RpoP
MPRQCADCGYEYPEQEFQATAPKDQQCPTCGSRRINAMVHARAIIVATAVGTPTIKMTTNVWATWMRIAVDRAKAARAARHDALNNADKQPEHLAREFENSMIGVAASAHALDALYGSSVIPSTVRSTFKQKRTPRRDAIREALKTPFATGPMNNQWVAEFDWLFDLRDAAAHAEESLRPAVPHPVGTNVSDEWATYRVETAERAVTFALDVLQWCIDHPRPNLPKIVEWSNAYRSTVNTLAQRWTT